MPPGKTITPDEIEQALAWLRTGRYRKGTVFRRLGYCEQACYMREKRARDARESGEPTDDFDLRVEMAMAEGEMAVCDDLHEAVTGKTKVDWRGHESKLRYIHRVADPVDEQRIAESKASQRAAEQAHSPEGLEAIRSIVSDLLAKRGGQSTGAA